MNRLKSSIVDFLISIIILVIFLFLFIYTKENMYKVETGQIELSVMKFRIIITVFISFLYLLVKDIIGDRSIGKKIFKLKIIDIKTGNIASLNQRLLRNIFIYIFSFLYLFFIIEFLMIVFNKGKRLGDIIAKTEVVDS